MDTIRLMFDDLHFDIDIELTATLCELYAEATKRIFSLEETYGTIEMLYPTGYRNSILKTINTSLLPLFDDDVDSLLKYELALIYNNVLKNKLQIINAEIYYPLHFTSEVEPNLRKQYKNISHVLPFIIKNDSIHFEVNYSDVQIKEFFSTFDIYDNSIKAGFAYNDLIGKNFEGLFALGSIDWESVWQVLSMVADIIGIVGGAIAFRAWLSKRAEKKDKPRVLSEIEILILKQSWNHNELARLLSINAGEAKTFLKAFHFEWNKNTLLYEKTEQSDRLIENISDQIMQYRKENPFYMMK